MEERKRGQTQQFVVSINEDVGEFFPPFRCIQLAIWVKFGVGSVGEKAGHVADLLWVRIIEGDDELLGMGNGLVHLAGGISAHHLYVLLAAKHEFKV